MIVELRQLEYFQMVSKYKNITKAAQELKVSQPTITIALQKLEEELEVTLIDRRQKKISLTAEGQVLLEKIEKVFSVLDDAKREMEDYKGLDKGTIRLGIPMMTGSYVFPQIFSGFRKLYPKIDFVIVEDGSLEVNQLLEDEKLDLGLILYTQEPQNLETLLVQNNELVACLPPEHPLAKKDRVSVKDLKDERFILFKENTLHRKVILDIFTEKGYKPNIILSSSQIETIHSLVANGMGITFLLDFIAHKFPDIHPLPLENPIKVEIALAWKKNKYLPFAAQALINYIKDGTRI